MDGSVPPYFCLLLISWDGAGAMDTIQTVCWGQGRTWDIRLHHVHSLIFSLQEKSLLHVATSSADSVLKHTLLEFMVTPIPKRIEDPQSQNPLGTFNPLFFFSSLPVIDHSLFLKLPPTLVWSSCSPLVFRLCLWHLLNLFLIFNSPVFPFNSWYFPEC